MAVSAQHVSAMLPLVLEFLEEQGFKKTAAAFREETKVEKPPKLMDLFEMHMKRKR
ncbi:hypothetical protein Ctob_005391, partial [Chrysochromulina tobinii]